MKSDRLAKSISNAFHGEVFEKLSPFHCTKIAFSLSQSDNFAICLIMEHEMSPNILCFVGVLFLFCILTQTEYFVKHYYKKIFHVVLWFLRESKHLP